MTLVTPEALAAFVRNSLVTAGASESDADVVADVFDWADRRGRFPQGSIWTELFVRRLRAETLNSPLQSGIDWNLPARGFIDAGDGFGHVAATLAADAVVERAREYGIAACFVSNSGHFGAAGYYADRIAKAGCLGLSFTNAYAKVAPFGGTSAVLGTNPMAFGLPRKGSMPIVGDLSTGAIAGSKVRDAIAEGAQLDEGVLLDADGMPTTDPHALGSGGVMLPTAGPKGFALGLMVEALTGAMAGGPVGTGVGSVFDTSAPVGVSHGLIAIQPHGTRFAELIDLLAEQVTAIEPSGERPVRLPGDAGASSLQASTDGLRLPIDTVQKLDAVADLLGLTPPWGNPPQN